MGCTFLNEYVIGTTFLKKKILEMHTALGRRPVEMGGNGEPALSLLIVIKEAFE